MKYPLADLLRVRLFREDAAQAEVTAARRTLETAEQTLAARQQELTGYIEYRKRREAELYDEIMNQQIQMRDLDDLKSHISQLQHTQGQFEDNVTQAKQDVRTANAALEEAQAAYSLAVKERQKIDEHKAIWAQEETQRCEAELEKEMEDFRVRKAEEID